MDLSLPVEHFVKRIKMASDWLGRTVSWCSFLMVIVMAAVVILRYGFNLGWIWLQETVLYLHAITLMLAMAYTLNKDEHVRVDIFYRKFSQRKKNKVNLFGHLLFLMPMCVFILFMSWSYVAQSWLILETSQEAGGLPLVYVLKSLLIIMPVLLLVQACAQILQIFFEQKRNQLGETK
ncbi:MAG: TRAP transporter small permease subunit [Gammaproteobacteria bacterium]|nr:TRAP transporter small permease subunit [Gammaproteobacteria bacterium]